jgi:hypothetical protein
MGGPETAAGFTGIVVNNFNFNFIGKIAIHTHPTLLDTTITPGLPLGWPH